MSQASYRAALPRVIVRGHYSNADLIVAYLTDTVKMGRAWLLTSHFEPTIEVMRRLKPVFDFLHHLSKPYLTRTVMTRVVMTFVLVVVPLIIFFEIADEIREKEPIGFDGAIQQGVHSLSSSAVDSVLTIITQFGGVLAIIIGAAALVVYLLYTHRQRMATIVLFGVGGAALINTVLKLIFERTRPDLWEHLVVEYSYSFPSGHAMASSALAFSVMAILWSTKWRWYAVAFGALYIVIIGFSRIYLGVHYPSDVIAGWCISAVWVVIVKQLIDHYKAQPKTIG